MLKVLFLLRGGLFLPFVIIMIFICFIGLLLFALLKPFLSYKSAIKIGDFWIYFFNKGIVLFLNLKIEVEGRENVPLSQKGCLFLFKHASHLDIPVLSISLPRSFRFGAKIELFKIPFFGTCLKMIDTLPVDRRARKKVLVLYEKSIINVEKGLSYALSPEGTRYEEGVLGGFKRGPFYFAVHAKTDILPVLVYGTAKAFHSKDKLACTKAWTHKIRLKILEPISTKHHSEQEVNALRDKVYKIMLKAYKEKGL